MKAVIIAADYVKDINGEFKVLEINTHTHILFKDANDYLDLDGLEVFVTENGITNIEIISPKHYQMKSIDLENNSSEPGFIYFENAIRDKFIPNNITVNLHYTSLDSITIPDIEDNDTTLIIRLSYDSTALIDSVYCADNFEFLKLMYDSNPTSIPSTYINDDELGFDSIGDNIRDNGEYPNYIIKQRFPTSDYAQYPKILKISTLEELNSIKSNLLANTLLQEYVFNPSDVLEGKLQTYRVISMVYGSNLDVLDLSHPFVHTNACAFGTTVDFDSNNELAIWERPCYLQKHGAKSGADLKFRYQFDDESKIFMPDGTISTIDDINSGSILKTLNFPDMPLDETDSGSVDAWKKSFTDLNNGLEVTTTNVVEYSSISRTVWLIHVNLANGVTFVDVDNGRAITKVANQTEYQFNRFANLSVGDSMLLFNNETNGIEESTISNIEYSYETINIYSVDVEPLDYLLTAEEGVTTPTYAMFQHNPPASCQMVCCSSSYPVDTYQQCATTGNSGWCYNTWPATYDVCTTGGYPYNCYACVSACAGSCFGAQK